MKAIYDTQEYKLAPRETQGYVFTHKGNYVDPETAAKDAGVDTEGTAAISTNLDRKIKVKFKVVYFSIKPDSEYRSVQAKLGNSPKYATFYMVKGNNPNSKRSEWFTAEAFNEAPEVKAKGDEMTKAIAKYRETHRANMLEVLRKSHHPLAKKLLADMPKLIDGGATAEEVGAWFRKQGFEWHGSDDIFKPFIAEYKKTGNIVVDWTVEHHARYGHTDGTNMAIDFNKKQLYAHGWSSDD